MRYAAALPYDRRMKRVLLDETINTDYGQFDITWDDSFGFDGDLDRVFSGQVNGLVGAAYPGGVYINLARRSGGSPVRIELCDEEPNDEPAYQDVVEVSLEIPSGAQVRWMSWASDSSGELTDIPAGSYRLRVCGKDRDAGQAGEFEEGPVDAYLAQLWPATPEPDSIVRVGSADAEYWHREVGSRR